MIPAQREAAEELAKPVKTKQCLLREGCTGCGRRWNAPGSEGQCSRCRRCLWCCGLVEVPYSCTRHSYEQLARDPAAHARSAAAYDRWDANGNILRHNRRIG